MYRCYRPVRRRRDVIRVEQGIVDEPIVCEMFSPVSNRLIDFTIIPAAFSARKKGMRRGGRGRGSGGVKRGVS